MNYFTIPEICIATEDDIPAITRLLNSAYRGEVSRQGWTTEAHLIAGDVRTDDDNLKEVIRKPGSVILKYTNDKNQLIGCVNLQKHNDRLYLGMFSVSPQEQGSGIGKKILLAAEQHALNEGVKSIYMLVISARHELIDWYLRHGYKDTGERKPFIEDGLTGKHLLPLEFMVLEKFVS
jgi:ribosomal protein S18 acetylase RimI-like enzyme